MSTREALLTLAICAATATFADVWLAMDHKPAPAPLVAKGPEPCLQLADLPLRKAYDAKTISRLCERQPFDERFHGHSKPIPKSHQE